MVKGATAGNLLADAIKKAHRVGEGVDHRGGEGGRARPSAPVAVTRTLAKAHGDGAAAAQKAIEAIRNVGLSPRQDAHHQCPEAHHRGYRIWTRPRASPRSPRTPPPSTPKGWTPRTRSRSIMLAIETGQDRGLRTHEPLPQDVAEAEEVARLAGATPRQDALRPWRSSRSGTTPSWRRRQTIQGPLPKPQGRTTGQMKKLARDMKDLKEDVGKAFQGELIAVVGLLKDVVAWLQRPHRRHREVRQGHAGPGRHHRHDHGGDQGVGARARRAQPRDGSQPGVPAGGRHHRSGRDYLQRVLRHEGGDGRPLQADGDGRPPEGRWLRQGQD